MARKMSPERELEFEELSRFLEYYSTNISGIDRSNEIHPSNCLVQIVEKYGKSQALQGLRQAINDTIEDTQDYDLDSVKKLDEELSAKGIITLSTLRSRYWTKYKRILKRGNIKNDTEYYMINGLLSDMSLNISQEQRDLLSDLISKYE